MEKMDIRLNISWYTSLKRKALIRRLGHCGVTAIIDFWLYVAQHRPDGNLTGLSDEDIAEAAQFDGDFHTFITAIGPKPEGLGFLDGDSGQRKVHDWKEHNPWAANAKARSRAAKKAVEERWRIHRVIRDEYEPNTERIQGVDEPYIPLSSPLPLPSLPSPSKTPAAKPSGNIAVAKWCDLYKIYQGEDYKVMPVNAKHIKDAFVKGCGSDIDKFETCLNNFFNDSYVVRNRCGPDFFYRNFNRFAKPPDIDPEIDYV
jgi:hypothetical protein